MTLVCLNSPVSTKGHTQVGFRGRGAPGYGGTFGYKEGAPDNLGAVGGEPLWGRRGGGGIPPLGCLRLTPFA